MKFNIRKVGPYYDIAVFHESIHVDLGFHDANEAKELATTLITAAWNLSPGDYDDARNWLKAILRDVGAEL